MARGWDLQSFHRRTLTKLNVWPYDSSYCTIYTYMAGFANRKLLQNPSHLGKSNKLSINLGKKKITDKHKWRNPTSKEGFIHEAPINVPARASNLTSTGEKQVFCYFD